ncbi:MAG: hypothetical protein RL497_2035, partial [Pseudomonadota bacterium]
MTSSLGHVPARLASVKNLSPRNSV